MTEAELSIIEWRAFAATPGPWTLKPCQFTCDCGPDHDHKSPQDCPTGWYDQAAWVDGPAIIEYGDEFGGFCDADADFMAHAREDVPALAAEIRRLNLRICRLVAKNEHDSVDGYNRRIGEALQRMSEDEVAA